MKILLVEDDLNLCNALEFQLKKEGFTIDACHSGDDGLFLARDNAHDLILLDRMIPGTDGIELLKVIRSEGISIPVIMITAMGELHDKVSGLDTGADDYIVKPFAFEELMARIRSLFRRPAAWEPAPALAFSDLQLDSSKRQLSGCDGTCTLSEKETELLEFFIRNAAQTLPRDMIINRVWGADSDIEEGNLDNYVYFIRRRLRSTSNSVKLTTVRGIGYRLEENNV